MGLLSLIWFRTKTLEVLKREMNYNVATPGHQMASFNGVTSGAMSCGLNEYDAAIAFMLLQLKSLSRPLQESVIDFYTDKLYQCKRLLSKSVGAGELLKMFLVDHIGDFSPDVLSRPGVAFVPSFIKETLEYFPVDSGPRSQGAPL